MSRAESGISADELLRHAGWLQRIARHLVHEDVEDVVQDVWAQVTEHPPSSGHNLRGWLARVLLNRARSRARSLVRRRQRDLHSAAWPEAAATPEEVTARLELQRTLAAAMVELPEPYRQVIYARYVEGREPGEIAALTGTPPGTVRWRLKEGLARLRARLDRESRGGRAVWLTLLAPLAISRQAAAWPRRLMGAAATAGVVAVFGLVVSRPQAGAPPATLPIESVTPALPARHARPPVFSVAKRASTGAGPSDELTACRAEAGSLRQQVYAVEARVLVGDHAEKLFARGESNPIAEATLRPLIDQIMAGDAGAGPAHFLECRTWVCKLALALTDAESTTERMRIWRVPLQDSIAMRARQRSAGGGLRSVPGLADPLSGVVLTRVDLYVILKDPSGEAVEGEGPRPEASGDLASCQRVIWSLQRRLAMARD